MEKYATLKETARKMCTQEVKVTLKRYENLAESDERYYDCYEIFKNELDRRVIIDSFNNLTRGLVEEGRYGIVG